MIFQNQVVNISQALAVLLVNYLYVRNLNMIRNER